MLDDQVRQHKLQEEKDTLQQKQDIEALQRKWQRQDDAVRTAERNEHAHQQEQYNELQRLNK